MKQFYIFSKFMTVTLALMLVSGMLNAQTVWWTQIGNDIDGETANDQSGNSVSLNSDGTVVAVGAYGNDANGSNAGHVRVYKKSISNIWEKLGNDIDGETADDFSGRSVSLSSDGSVVAIGAPGPTNGVGYVKIFKFESGAWTQIGAKISGEAASDNFGFSTSLSSDGSIVAIGAPGNGSGYVQIYENQGGTWTQIANVAGEVVGDNSGRSVSLSSNGSRVAIGSPGNGAGHARIFEKQSGTWNNIAGDGVTINGVGVGDLFGYGLDLSSDGTVVAIGAYNNDIGGSNSGQVRIYKNELNTWTWIGEIDGKAASDFLGRFAVSLSSDGSIVAVGAYGNSAGYTRVFQNQSGTWMQLGSDIVGEALGDYSGYSVSLNSDGSKLAIGAKLNRVYDKFPHAANFINCR